MKHSIVSIQIKSGKNVAAQAPIIVSASRATDIPAFYTKWLFNRLNAGYVKWRNPFSGSSSYVSFEKTRFIVFWSKNPAPLLPYLPVLEEKGIGCYIQYTLNDYIQERLEPNVPTIGQRVDTFKRLVEKLGKGRVVWRFDPLVLTDEIDIDCLLSKIGAIADHLQPYAEKLVFSYADVSSYRRVPLNLQRYGVKYKEWDEPAMTEFASRLSEVNSKRWGFVLATCAEGIDLGQFGVVHNRCIDPELISRFSRNDQLLLDFLHSAKRDSGQRKCCGCIISKDIGSYNTCAHGCRYCYANSSPNMAALNQKHHNPLSETIV